MLRESSLFQALVDCREGSRESGQQQRGVEARILFTIFWPEIVHWGSCRTIKFSWEKSERQGLVAHSFWHGVGEATAASDEFLVTSGGAYSRNRALWITLKNTAQHTVLQHNTSQPFCVQITGGSC